MDLIKEEGEIAPSCCVHCLSNNNDRNIQNYKVQSEHLKIIFKVDELSLCYICKKLIQNAEFLIEKILNNQITVNLQNFSEQNSDVTVHPFLNVTVLEPIDISGIDEQTENPTSVDENSVYKECIVKDEMKSESEDCMQSDYKNFIDIEIDVKNEFVDNNGESESPDEMGEANKPVKKKQETKRGRKRKNTEVPNEKIEEINCQRDNDINDKNAMNLFEERETNQPLKRTKKKQSIEQLSIRSIYINEEQLMQERKIKANEQTYINCTYKCEDCVKGFAFKVTYERHMELHSKDKGDYECNICKQRTDTSIKLLRHTKLHHIRFKCLICGVVQKATMRDHYNSCHSENAVLYTCKTCPRKFTDRYYLRKHASHCRKNKRVQCEHCMKTYANKDGLKIHIQMRHPSLLPPIEINNTVSCKECGKAFRCPSQLRSHSLKHSSEKRFYCVECDKSYKCEYTLKQHLKLAAPHANPSELHFPCTMCDKRFGIKRDLERHMNRIHLNIRPYKCDLCEKAFNNSWGLKKHKMISHEGYKRPFIFPCTVCDKIFDQKSILKAHIRTHTGERPYQCTRCPAKFTQSSSLSTHTKLVHLKQTRDGKPKNLK